MHTTYFQEELKFAAEMTTLLKLHIFLFVLEL
jgi:hypothetical protein